MPRRDLILALVLAAVTAASRVPWRTRLLPTWDAVQFALALREYDIAKHQPHPPGYILYVGAARALDALVGDAALSLTALSILASAVTVFLAYRLGWMLYGRSTAVVAALGLAASPLFWFYGEVALPYTVEAALAAAVATLVWPMRCGRTGFAAWSALALGLAGGVRQSVLVVLGPFWLGMAWAGLRQWRPVVSGCAVLVLTSAAWFVPMVWLAGGPERYVGAALELFESTVRATTIVGPPGGWLGNVRGLGEALLMGLGLTLPGIAWLVARGVGRVPGWGAREWFFAAWIVPPLAVYTLVHFGQYGYLLTVLPALWILTARGLVGADASLGVARGTPALARRLLWGVLAAVVIAHAVYFLGARPVDVPPPASHASALERGLGAARAFYRFVLWAHTAGGLQEQEGVIRAYAEAVRRDFDPARTVLVTELGNPRSYPWFRHASYYLPEFTTIHLRLGGLSRGYLWSRALGSMAALPDDSIHLPSTADRLVWMVDYWNPTLPRLPGLRERPLAHGRWLYVLDLDRRPVEHGAYRLTPEGAQPAHAGCARTGGSVHVPTFHGDPRRLGWNPADTELTPARVRGPAFGPLWSSPQLDPVILGGQRHAPHLYATPLYVEDVAITTGPYAGYRPGVVLAASSNGWVYAISAFGCANDEVKPGTILWRTRVAVPAVVPDLDGGVPIGILSTPTIDLAADPRRLYVAAMDATAGWQVSALELEAGRILPGWPVAINDDTLAPTSEPSAARFGSARERSQRSALNLSPRGDLLYVAFGGAAPGWMIAVDTRRPRIVRAFASAQSAGRVSNGGMWSAGGPAVDAEGRVYMTTGNSPADAGETPGVWGSSLLQWAPRLELLGTYTPFNYCVLDRGNMDLVGPAVLPDLAPATTSTPRLIVFGGKQGTLYLVDRDRLPGRMDRRPPCGPDAARDGSLLPAGPQPQFGTRGPIHVFGPYSDERAQLDHARMRTTPAYYRDSAGTSYLFVTGSSKASMDSAASVPPGLVRLRVVTAPGSPAYLAIDRRETETTLLNPGSPVVTSNGPRDAVVWVLDPNMPRLAPLVGPGVARPVLYAFDATTLTRVWRSAPGMLEVGGKYSSPTVARGVVFVGTDRIQAFGLRPNLQR